MLKRRRAARRTSSILTRGSCKLYVVSFIAPRRRFTTRVPKKQFGGAGQALQAAPGAALSRDRHRLPRRLDHALVATNPSSTTFAGCSTGDRLPQHAIEQQMAGHWHDPTAATQNQGNQLGSRPCVRQSQLFRQNESGNTMKSLLGSSHLQWDTKHTQGAYAGRPAYDAHTDYMAQTSIQGKYHCANEMTNPFPIPHKKEWADVERANGTNKEADAAWRTMGLTGIVTSAALLAADKSASDADKKALNMTLGAAGIATGAMFATHSFFDQGVKPELKWLNAAGQLGVGAYALSKALK